MGKFIIRCFTFIGFVTVMGMLAIAVVMALLWWQDKQWQAKAASDRS